LPPGFHSPGAFGSAIGWGTFDETARRRASAITREEVVQLGITIELAHAWRDFYVNVVRETPRNPSARGRIEPMQRIIELLETVDE
jgi:hypothetical protein